MGLKIDDLKKAIYDALNFESKIVKGAGEEQDKINKSINDTNVRLADELSKAIDAFVRSGEVKTDVSKIIVDPNSGKQIPPLGEGKGKIT